jgi:hypothetical protein
MPTFTPPTVDEGPAGPPPLFYRYKITRADAVLKTDGVYTRTRVPTEDEIAAADIYYAGGRGGYTITAGEAADLTTAGYGAYIT